MQEEKRFMKSESELSEGRTSKGSRRRRRRGSSYGVALERNFVAKSIIKHTLYSVNVCATRKYEQAVKCNNMASQASLENWFLCAHAALACVLAGKVHIIFHPFFCVIFSSIVLVIINATSSCVHR